MCSYVWCNVSQCVFAVGGKNLWVVSELRETCAKCGRRIQLRSLAHFKLRPIILFNFFSSSYNPTYTHARTHTHDRHACIYIYCLLFCNVAQRNETQSDMHKFAWKFKVNVNKINLFIIIFNLMREGRTKIEGISSHALDRLLHHNMGWSMYICIHVCMVCMNNMVIFFPFVFNGWEPQLVIAHVMLTNVPPGTSDTSKASFYIFFYFYGCIYYTPACANATCTRRQRRWRRRRLHLAPHFMDGERGSRMNTKPSRQPPSRTNPIHINSHVYRHTIAL